MRTSVADREVPVVSDGKSAERLGSAPRRLPRRRWGRWLLLGLVLLAAGAFTALRMQPLAVSTSTPESRWVAETISSSGVVQGHIEATVGSQVPGIVTRLVVEEGDRVHKGQPLAEVQDNLARQQVEQSRAALETAKAALAQASALPQRSEIRAADARTRQAQAGIEQAVAAFERARISEHSAAVAAKQAQSRVAQAGAALSQAKTRLQLALKNLERKRSLAEAGAIPAAALDEAQSSYDVAVADRNAAQESLDTASLGVEAARDSQNGAAQDKKSAQSQVDAARAQAQAVGADARTVRAQPRAEVVRVAARRVSEALAAFEASQLSARNTVVLAPFAGTITQVLAHPGSTSAAGILRLVGTEDLEVKVDLDEADIHAVRIGQRAILAASDKEVEGRVSRLGAQIDSLRGTLQVFIVPQSKPYWLTAGQTLNVNIVTIERVKRLMVPAEAVQREGDRTILYVLREGRAKAVPVRLGQLAGDRIPVLEGIAPNDRVVQNAIGLTPDTRIQAKER